MTATTPRSTPKAPQDRRPPLKKQTAGSKARRQQQMDADAVGVRIDGVDYVINPHDLTGRVEFEIRREIGMGLAELQERLESSPGVDYLGMFMWAVRYANGEDVDLMEVLDSVSAGSDVEVMKADDAQKAQASAPKA